MNEKSGWTLKLWASVALLALGLAGAPIKSDATIVIPPSFSLLVEQSDTIIDGEVTNIRVGHDGAGKGIYTFVTLKVIEAVKGSPATPYVLRLAGGALDGEASSIEGTPIFEKGDRALFFIRGNGIYSVPLVGMMYGTYWVEKDPATGENAVLKPDGNPLLGTEQIDAEHAAGLSPTHSYSKRASKGTRGALKLEEFKQAIRQQSH